MSDRKPSRKCVDIPGFTIAALEWGDPEGVPVLALHGWLDNAATFGRLAPRLADQLHVVSIDFPGHGRSTHRADGESYYFADLVPVIFDVADALEWTQFSILGHSMGAAAGYLAAGTQPDRIRRLVALDSLGPWTTPPEQAPEQLESGLEERNTLRDKSKRTFDSPDDALSVICELYALHPEQARPLVDRGLEQRSDGDWQFSYDLLLRGASLVRFTESQIVAFLERITAPTLLLRPEDGWPCDEAWLERRMASVADLEFQRVPGGHHSHLQYPEHVREPVDAFLSPSL